MVQTGRSIACPRLALLKLAAGQSCLDKRLLLLDSQYALRAKTMSQTRSILQPHQSDQQRPTSAEFAYEANTAQLAKACRAFEHEPNSSATNWQLRLADWIRSAGDLACSFSTNRQSHVGVSELISRIGRGVASVIRRKMPNVVSARNGVRPVHIAYTTLPETKQIAAMVDRIAPSLLG